MSHTHITLSGSEDAQPTFDFVWDRSGPVKKNTWMLNDEMPSNQSGRTMFLDNAEITKMFVANGDPTVITIEVYTHDGNEIGLSLIGSVTTAALRTNSFDVSFLVPRDKQIALKTADIIGNVAKNIVVGVSGVGDA